MRTVRAVVLAAILLSTLTAQAQKHELAGTLGGDFVNTGNFSVDPSFALELSYAHRLFHAPRVGLYGELPLAGSFNHGVGIACITLVGASCPRGFSSFFLTPGLKLKVAAGGMAPYLVLGAGLGHFHQSTTTGSTSANTGTVDFGGGVDFNVLPVIGFRAEVRDFYSGLARFGLTATGRQHNVFLTGGFVLRF